MLIGIYSGWLVLVSLFVAMFASYTALDMAGRITASQTRFAAWLVARRWLIRDGTRYLVHAFHRHACL